jgi:putative addiction module antidote
MIRHLFKTENSTVVALPREILDDLGIKEGDRLNLEVNEATKSLIITPAKKPLTVPGVDEAFARQVDEFIEQYRPALEELAN